MDKIVYYGMSEINKEVFTGKSGGKINHFLREKDNLNFIVFGSSRANHHVDTKTIENKSFNIGMDGSNLAHSVTLVKTLPLDKKQTVLLHISPKHAFKKEYKGEDVEAFAKLYHTNKVMKEEIDKLNQRSVLNNFYWCLDYNNSILGLLKNYFFPNYNADKYYGYDPLKVSPENRATFKKILDKKEKETCPKNLKINSVYEQYLVELKNFCDQNHKRLVMYTSPVFRDDCKDDDLIISALLEEMGINYWNYTDFFEGDSSLQNWKDNTHLSEVGAVKFTREIKNRLIKNKLLPK
ncbi:MULTISPECIES: hypothetical protein [Maribacter]|uniref:SGNH/GDSL hydrolase family protein n=1 Tax=Maribacter flavus TaxID=1658664 RepID=A0ABU7IJC0_9FLAO|nr:MULTISPECIES: hypothetical protein [Maribacter]MDC6405692.1 hypothetical protein [Maribacter sp. PR66]MEE1973056.1 hypothetical protein [Maribacter flavus]